MATIRNTTAHPPFFKTGIFWARTATALSVALFLLSFQAVADQDGRTDTVSRQLPYSGTLKLNGSTLTKTGEEAPWMKFELLDEGPDGVVVHSESMQVNVYAGEFTAMLNPSDAITNADNLYLQLTMLNNHDPQAPASTADDDAVLGNPQRLLLSPFAMWASRAVDFNVSNNLTVDGATTLYTNALNVSAITADSAKINRTATFDSVVIGGQTFNGFTVSSEYTDAAEAAVGSYGGWSNGVTMTPTANSICVQQQTYAYIGAVDSAGNARPQTLEGYNTACEIVQDNGNWKLRSLADNYHNIGYARANCSARCLSW